MGRSDDSYATNGDGSFGGVGSGGSGGSSGGSGYASKEGGSYLGAGGDVAKQVPIPGWPSYITMPANTNEGTYGKQAAKDQWWLVQPDTGSYKRLNYYYSLLPAEAKKKWKSPTSFWKWAVDLSYKRVSSPNQFFGTKGGVKQTPWDVMSEFTGLTDEEKRSILSASGSGSGSGSGGGMGGTYVSTSVNYTDAKTARLLVNQVYQQLLGREATDQEAAAYLSDLHGQEKANPDVTTTVVSSSGKSQSSTKTGGTNSQEIAKETAEAEPEFGRYQTETTYLNAFMQALSAPIQGV